MQRRDDIGVIDARELQNLYDQVEKHKRETHRVIGNLPKAGESVFIHGLEYEVKKTMPRGRVLLKLKGIVDENGQETRDAGGR